MPPSIIYMMGFDTTGSPEKISKATPAGITTVFQVIPADLADDNTGAIIRATTAGLIPLKIELQSHYSLSDQGKGISLLPGL